MNREKITLGRDLWKIMDVKLEAYKTGSLMTWVIYFNIGLPPIYTGDICIREDKLKDKIKKFFWEREHELLVHSML